MTLLTYLNTEHQRWFLWWPVGMGVGALSYFKLSFEPYLLLVLFLSLFTITGLVWALSTFKDSAFFNETPIRFFVYGCLSLIIGFTVAKIRTELLSTPMLSCSIKDVVVIGTIKDIEHPPYKKGNKRRIIINNLSYQKGDPPLPHTLRLNISDHFLAGQPGDRIRCQADLLPINLPLSLYGYDFQQQAYFSGIGGVGRVKKACTLIETAKTTLLARWRYQLTEVLRKAMPGNNGQIAAALVTGDRSGIPKEIRQNFTDSGIAHILAISGLHISLVAGFIFLIIRRGFALIPFFVERYFIKKWAAVVSIFITACYLSISGFGFPAQRAFFMTTLVMMGVCLDRNPISMRSLAIAATLILLFFPESILSISFQLSFAAVIALIAAYEGGWDLLKNWIANEHWSRKYLSYGFCIVTTTIIATAATTPLIIYTFNRFTLQAIAGNLVAIPLIGLWIMPIALLAVVSITFGGFTWLFKIWNWGLTALIFIAEKISHWPGAAILIATPPYLFLVLSMLGGLWLCLWNERWRWWGVIPITFSCILIFYDQHPHLYLSEEVIAYRSHKTLNVSSIKRGTFAVEMWAKELGITKIKPWPQQIVLYPLKGNKITLIADPFLNQKGKKYTSSQIKTFIKPYCAQGLWLFSNGYIWKTCKDQTNSTHILDRFQLSRRGAHFIWFYLDKTKIINAKQYFGNRPWRVKIKKRKWAQVNNLNPYKKGF